MSIETYKKNIKHFENELKIAQKKSKIIAYSRAVVFATGIVLGILLKDISSLIMATAIAVSAIVFLFLVRKNFVLSIKIKFQKTYLKINKDELTALEGNFSNFHNGNEFKDPSHSFSYDLDVFGNSSIFQYLNRSCTVSGKINLADNLKNIQKNKDIILSRQEAVNELSNKIDFRQKFAATGIVHSSKNEAKNSISDLSKENVSNWTKENLCFAQNKLFKLFTVVFTLITVVLIILSIFGVFPSFYFIVAGIIQLTITGAFLKNINKEHAKLTDNIKQIIKLKELISVIENEKFESKYLTKLKNKLTINDKTAGEELTKLNSVLKAFDFRLNFLFAFLANMFLMWDLQIVFQLEKFKKKLSNIIEPWFETVGEFDSLSCFANFAYNNPNFTFPEVSKSDFKLEALSSGHPLIPASLRITNDYSILNLNEINIITGANMAGKSTFLRTVGINLILASAGSKVCAEKYIFSPIDIYTSIRNDDSLEKNESYFYAELMRIKNMIDRLKSGEKLFIILDEILRGTNSKDKHTGSRKLIEKLINYNISGLVATHDIQLGNLIEEYPENIKNKRFEVEIQNNKLHFDYKLKNGISQNLNATFLLKKYDII